MKCEECKAWGIDNLGYHGCLIRNEIKDLPSGKFGCYKRETTISRMIEEVKQNESRADRYKWRQ